MFSDGRECSEEIFENSGFCILHIPLPEYGTSEEFTRIAALKEEKVKEKVNRRDFNFEGAKLVEFNFPYQTFKDDLNFIDAVLLKCFIITGSRLERSGLLDRIKVGESIWGDTTTTKGDVKIRKCQVKKDIVFTGATMNGNVEITESEVGGDVWFPKSKIDGNFFIDPVEIKGKLVFRDAEFKFLLAQETACRAARRISNYLGDRLEADYYSYREMEAKRKQKHKVIRFLEAPIQYFFGYGLYPLRVIGVWGTIVLIFAFIFWNWNGVAGATTFLEHLYFSVATVVTMGYGDYHPIPGIFQGLASFEAIFGMFMWAAFIVIFARKFMR